MTKQPDDPLLAPELKLIQEQPKLLKDPYARQAALYLESFSALDVQYTARWWEKYAPSLAFPPNKLRREPLHHLNELIRPSTIQAMTTRSMNK